MGKYSVSFRDMNFVVNAENEDEAMGTIKLHLKSVTDMTNYHSYETGLHMVVWLDNRATLGGRSIPHSKFKIKYGTQAELSITFIKRGVYTVIGNYKDRDYDIADVFQWLYLDYDALVRLYTGKREDGSRYTIEDFYAEKRKV